MVRLKDIAEVCGVSVATVSRALNGLTNENRERTSFICQTARDMGSYPNTAARTLKTSRSNNLGILYEDRMNHEYFSSLFDELRREADMHGYDLTFPLKYRAERFDTARWVAIIPPTYRQVGWYSGIAAGAANETTTWLSLFDLETDKHDEVKVATEDPPRTITVQTINGIPMSSGASGEFREEDALARLTERIEAARTAPTPTLTPEPTPTATPTPVPTPEPTPEPEVEPEEETEPTGE